MKRKVNVTSVFKQSFVEVDKLTNVICHGEATLRTSMWFQFY